MSEMAIRTQIRHARGAFALDVTLDIPAHGITGILGRSGCGKTSLLRCIAGLERECRGTIEVQGQVWQDARRFLPPHERAVGFVFQESRLFPHLTIAGNLRYGLRRAKTTSVHFDDVVGLLGLGEFLERKPAGLSGGELQRVAIGRALLRNPLVLLMDEPLANLDPERKQEILPFLERLHGRLTIPIVYVSHSVDEVSRLCDYVVMLDAGRVTAHGGLNDVLAEPRLTGVLGEEIGTVLAGEVAGYDAGDELTRLRTDAGELLVTGRHGDVGRRLRVRIQARDISVALTRPADTTILNILPAVVEAVASRAGGHVDVTLRVGGAKLLSRISRRSCEMLDLRPDTSCYAQVKGVAVKG